MRVLPAILACMVALALASPLLTPADAARKVDCGSTHTTVGTERLGGLVKALHVSCRTARGVIHFALGHTSGNAPDGPRGWTCARGGSPEVSSFAIVCSKDGGNARAWLMNQG